MKILLADDHFLVLDGLEVLLSTLPFVESTTRALDYFSLREQLEKETLIFFCWIFILVNTMAVKLSMRLKS